MKTTGRHLNPPAILRHVMSSPPTDEQITTLLSDNSGGKKRIIFTVSNIIGKRAYGSYGIFIPVTILCDGNQKY